MSKFKAKGHKVKNFGMNIKATSQEMYMWNMKALYLMVQTLWKRLQFL